MPPTLDAADRPAPKKCSCGLHEAHAIPEVASSLRVVPGGHLLLNPPAMPGRVSSLRPWGARPFGASSRAE